MGYLESVGELDALRAELRRTHSGAAFIRALEDRIERERDPNRLQILNRFLADEHIAQGDLDAADAVHRRDPAYEVDRWYDDWWENEPGDMVLVIEARLRNESHPLKLAALRRLLADEYREQEDYAAAEAVYLAAFAADPDEPRPLISLARQKLRNESQPEAAMRIVDRAIAAAIQAGLFRREALGVKARIALRLAAYPVVEDVMRAIMRLAFTPGMLDADIERDFLDHLPARAIDAEVARAYDAYCRAGGWAGTASDQHVDGLILSSASARWQKVAMVVAKVCSECKRDSLQTNVEVIGDRVRNLVVEGKLQAQGDLEKMRRSEIRLAGS